MLFLGDTEGWYQWEIGAKLSRCAGCVQQLPDAAEVEVAGNHSFNGCIAALLLQSQSLDKFPYREMVHVEEVTKSTMPSLRSVVGSSQTLGCPLVGEPENLVKKRRVPLTASTERTDVCLLKVAKEVSDLKII